MISDDRFGVAFGIDVRRIKEVTTEFDVMIDDAVGFIDGRAPSPVLPEGHGPQTEWADAQAGTTEGEVVIQWHCGFLRRWVRSWNCALPGAVSHESRKCAR
jgi:hypothetical protein